MFSPFVKGKLYFIKTITFYYIARYDGKSGKFYKFKNVQCLLSIPDWEDFFKSRPHLPPGLKPLPFPDLALNADGIMDVAQWD